MAPANFLLEQLKGWAGKGLMQKEGINTYWIYSLPGISKTLLARSICASLHEESYIEPAC